MTRTFHLVVFCVIISFINTVPGSDVYSSKRGRPQYSSLIPFPRVGRSGAAASSGSGSRDLMYYGQKRGGKSGLIPFPRVGRGGGNTWDLEEDEEEVQEGPGRYEEEEREYATVPSKRQSLIPFPRVGKREGQDRAYHRRLLRSPKPTWNKDDFKRRITKKASLGRNRDSFNRRILRSGYTESRDGFKRRITRSWSEATPEPELVVRKRQSLIPFPRTGKRSGSTESTNSGELDQVYIYDSQEDDPEVEPEPEPKEQEDDFDIMVNSDEFDDEDTVDEDSIGVPYSNVYRRDIKFSKIGSQHTGPFYQEY